MSGTTKLRCSCVNTFQDKKYGKQIRVMNKTDDEGTYRCTVCTKERTGTTRRR